jgi:hypothetical protein
VSECSKQASFDDPPVLAPCFLEPALGKMHGHVNWAPATYTGKITFDEFSSDKDLDFSLMDFVPSEVDGRFAGWQPKGLIGQILSKDSQGNPDYQDKLHMEFAGYELTQFLGGQWQQFHYATTNAEVDSNTNTLQDVMNQKTAVVTGLLNLDCVHECHTELHPIYAMAFRTSDEYCASGQTGCKPITLDDDPWLIVARNFGNEGSCSLEEHYLHRDSISLFLPAPRGAGMNPEVRDPTAFTSNVKDLRWKLEYKQADHGVLITFFLNSGGVRANGTPVHISGQLRLNWIDSQTSLKPAVKDLAAAAPSPKSNSKRSSKAQVLESSALPQDSNPVILCKGLADPACEPLPPQWPTDAQILADAKKFTKERQDLRNLKKQKAAISSSGVLKGLAQYWQSNLGLFAEGLHPWNGRGMQIGPGARVELFQTPLGSVEIDTASGLHPTSIVDQRYDSKTFDWLLGVRVQVARRLAPFIEVKGGGLQRWADTGFRVDSNLVHFDGYHGIFYAGAGLQPFREHFRMTIRFSAGLMRVPGTGENIIRLTVGPQIRFKRSEVD